MYTLQMPATGSTLASRPTQLSHANETLSYDEKSSFLSLITADEHNGLTPVFLSFSNISHFPHAIVNVMYWKLTSYPLIELIALRIKHVT